MQGEYYSSKGPIPEISNLDFARQAFTDGTHRPQNTARIRSCAWSGRRGRSAHELTSARIGKQLELVTAVPTAAVALVCAIPVG